MNSISFSVAEDLPIAVLGVDPASLNIQWANVEAQGFLGLSLRALREKSLCDLFTDGEALRRVSANVVRDLAPVKLHDLPLQSRAQDGETCDVHLFPSGNGVGVCLSRPETTRASDSVAGDAMAAMGRMLAHEIKNPLAGINGAAQLLSMDIVTDEAKDLLQLIQSEIARIGRLTDRMERLGDINVHELEPVNVHAVLQQARAVMINSIPDNVRITEHYDPSVPEAEGHADGLIQAVINLIKNAIESISASGQGNEIRLETAFTRGIRQKLEDGSGYRELPILLSISDNGPGISPDIRDNLFQPFVSTKPTGQGLGLSMVSKVVAAHQGQINVSQEAGWTRFSIFLPLSRTEKSKEQIR